MFKKKALEKAGVAPDDIAFCLEHVDHIPNLQLLEGAPNQEKSATSVDAWLSTTYPKPADRSAYRERHAIPEGGALAPDVSEVLPGAPRTSCPAAAHDAQG